MESLTVIENVACTGCGCVCDDLRLTVSHGRIVRAEGACRLAEPWLLAQNAEDLPIAEIEGEPVGFDEALARASALLRTARYPLIYGLSHSTTEGQRAALLLADRLRAVIDTTASVCHAPSIMAQQQVGQVTCTLGEVRNHADMVVFWGSDPVSTHPRHWERYSVDPPGRFTPRGRADRFVVVADTSRTASAEAADLFVPIEPGKHFEALSALRAIVRGARPAQALPELTELARRMTHARCGVVFFGVNLARGESGHCNVQALLQLVTDLNVPGRWFAMRMRVQGNVVGADSVLGWQTGYPFGVDLTRGYPRFNANEFSIGSLLQRREVDACLIIGSETLSWLPDAALENLQQIPTVILDQSGRKPVIEPTVLFRVGTAGVHVPGIAYRMDGVPIPLQAVLPSRYPSDELVLNQIAQKS